LEANQIEEREYDYDEKRTLEKLWWPIELLYNVFSLQSIIENVNE
jgi:hypothetical protein